MSQQQTLIGIVGDRNPANSTHVATERALTRGSDAPAIEWLPTETIASGLIDLSRHAGLLISPGSPYQSMAGALAAIRHAREQRVPLLGTCGGFQHLVIEFARNVAAIADADHAETSPDASRLIVTALACSLVGQTQPVRVHAGTQAASIYGTAETLEPYFCSFGLSPQFRPQLEAHGLVISGTSADGAARIVELPSHPFFFGTLYVPQARHSPAGPHPLISAFVSAARARHAQMTAERAA